LISVGVLGNKRLKCLPIASLTLDERRIDCPAPIDEQQANIYRSLALRAFRSLGCRDFARVDLIVDSQGQPHLTGVHTSGILEKNGTMGVMASAAGLGWEGLVGTIVELASARCGVDQGITSKTSISDA
jgi:D-alanine-D-alanine ligase-like ATP-grasp enzyme